MRTSRLARRPRALIALGLMVATISLGVGAVRVYSRIVDLQQRVSSVETIAKDDGRLDLKQIGVELTGAQRDIAELRLEIGWLLPVAGRLSWMPRFGHDLAAVPALFDVAESVIAAASLTFEGLSPVTGALNGETLEGSTGPLTGRIIGPLDANRSLFEQAESRLDAAAEMRSSIDTANLSERLTALITRVDKLLPLMRLAIDGGLVLPDLLGANGARSYLVVAQNEDELRPTGGFISAAGRLTVDHGKLMELEFQDSYQVDDLSKEYPEPPLPLKTYMLSGVWLFRDANWSPDFPTSAQQLAYFYTYGRGQRVDGVIALDQEMVSLLVRALSPLDIDGSDAVVTGDNLLSFMRAAWGPSQGESTAVWFPARKDFIGKLAKAMQ
ncbi:MAG: DUF4012 domain-containing protein, partial [Chloroflexi bacterium]|nr:DUF4012 domain-containing protein [Chloroflexota bacterium]